MPPLIHCTMSAPYWLRKEFICPVKIETYKMLENFLKDSPLFLFVVCYDSVIAAAIGLFAWLGLPDVPAQSILNYLAIILGLLRIFPAFMASMKAWRDRKHPELGKPKDKSNA